MDGERYKGSLECLYAHHAITEASEDDMDDQEERKHKKVFIFNRSTPNTVANIGRALPSNPSPPVGAAGVPVAPGAAGVPVAPGAAGVPVAPGAAGVPVAPGAAGVPVAPGAAGVPVAPGAAGVPVAPGAAGAPLVPGMPGGSSLPPALQGMLPGAAMPPPAGQLKVQKASSSSGDTPPSSDGSPGDETAAGIEGLKTSPITVTPQGITKGAALSAELPEGASAMGAGAPKVLISALKEKVSYMIAFQMKINSLSKQLKGLMNRTGHKAPDLPPPPERQN